MRGLRSVVLGEMWQLWCLRGGVPRRLLPERSLISHEVGELREVVISVQTALTMARQMTREWSKKKRGGAWGDGERGEWLRGRT